MLTTSMNIDSFKASSYERKVQFHFSLPKLTYCFYHNYWINIS